MTLGKCATINTMQGQLYKVRFFDFSLRYGRYVLTEEKVISNIEAAKHLIDNKGYLYREHPKF